MPVPESEPEGRTGLMESSQFNLVMLHRKRREMKKRISTRILFREKLKKMSTQKFSSRLRKNESVEIDKIQIGNETHKLEFLQLLGLSPKITPSIVPKIPHGNIQPVVKLERLPDNFMTNCHKISNSPPPALISLDEEEFPESDDDLDLELVFCPLDIPEIYEQITKKPCPLLESSTPSRIPASPFSSGSSESGYESTESRSRASSPVTFNLINDPKKFHDHDHMSNSFIKYFEPCPQKDWNLNGHSRKRTKLTNKGKVKKSKGHLDEVTPIKTTLKEIPCQDADSIENIRQRLCLLQTQVSFVED